MHTHVQERDEWCKILRTHALHHNLSNGYEYDENEESEPLGLGASGTVRLVKDKVTAEQFAAKFIPRSQVRGLSERLLYR
jgi:hypothetical protein